MPWWRTPTARRYLFGYTLLAPAVLYVALLVGLPFLFSLYLAMSDASVGAPVARFIGIENFVSALENATFYVALRNTVVFTVGAGILKGLLGTSLAFLLLQPFKGRKVVRALLVIPFTLPIAVSVLGWKWMFDSQFSVINWALSRLSLIGSYGSPDWPVWLGQPGLALFSVMFVNVWRGFPFSAIVLLAGLTSVPPEIIDAAKVDGASFLQRFRKVIVPMIAPILFIGTRLRHGVHAVRPLDRVPAHQRRARRGDRDPARPWPTTRGSGLARSAGARPSRSSCSRCCCPAMILLLRTLRRRQY